MRKRENFEAAKERDKALDEESGSKEGEFDLKVVL
jgi:hypothetical protein